MARECAVILAAGKGTRMKSARAKVLHEVFGRPMAAHVVGAVREAGVGEMVVVTGHQAEAVEAALAGKGVRFARQTEQLGTGHAVLTARGSLPAATSTVLILCGDTPLVEARQLREMLGRHRAAGSVLTVMTTVLDNPANYGRIITDGDGSVLAIVEEKDASEEQRRIREINAGIYCVRHDFLFSALNGVDRNNSQGEMYLTDIVGIARRQGYPVARYLCAEAWQVLGVNSRRDLAEAEGHFRRRKNEALMAAGVTLEDPATAYIGAEVEIGADTVLAPQVVIRGASTIGRGCRIGPFCLIEDGSLADGGVLPPYSHLVAGKKLR